MPQAVDTQPVPVNRNLSGEEAFAHRLAMSSSTRLHSPPALRRDNEDPSPGLSSGPISGAPPPTETGEEAYLRRVALSHLKSDLSPPAHISSPEAALSSVARSVTETPQLAYNPFAPPSIPPPPGPPPPFSNALEDKVKAAAAIAAKLGALAGSSGSASSSVPEDEHSPAKR
jgi:splicing factor 45